jgi:hypothetical protein
VHRVVALFDIMNDAHDEKLLQSYPAVLIKLSPCRFFSNDRWLIRLDSFIHSLSECIKSTRAELDLISGTRLNAVMRHAKHRRNGSRRKWIESNRARMKKSDMEVA